MKQKTATQKFVDLQEVREGIVILKDGGMRSILLASSINLALKSEDEQQAVLKQFQNFLNTLDFSLQMYIQSRELDIQPYLDLLYVRESEQENQLMQIQLREYIGFVKGFVEEAGVMTKSFFVVIPYAPSTTIKKGVADIFKAKKSNPTDDAARFEEHRLQLEQRMGVVSQGLARCGIRTIKLGTDEAVELFYQLYNPNEKSKVASYT